MEGVREQQGRQSCATEEQAPKESQESGGPGHVGEMAAQVNGEGMDSVAPVGTRDTPGGERNSV
ncbi:Hypothetical predicted protein [Marmota monax]|uniref:Uncharacterized protein n=1 Tax=Marmota monax TaxID=9995 RepID=A0A5E4AQU3_MARMO|nr:hypothetical protein GHT09_008262 [Marmota monax]VTJ59708.1 Hypothetical predicted protein [Marmota monax]